MKKVGTLITAAIAAQAVAPHAGAALTRPLPRAAAPAYVVLAHDASAPVAPAAAPDTRDGARGESRGAVTAVSVAPAEGTRTEVVIKVDRPVEVQDFVLDSPRRVVLDLVGAQLAMVGAPYDKVARGAVTNVRLSQFRAGVVRVVVELDGRHQYKVERADNAVRLVVDGGAAGFAPWQSGMVSVASRTAEPRGEKPAAEPRSERPASPAPVAAAPTPRAERVATEAPAAYVAPQREAEPRPATRVEPARRAPAVARITVTYQEADIRDVIAAFAAFSGRTIIVGKEVTGMVTAEIKDQPWDVALRAVLASQALALSEDRNGILLVDSYKNIASNRAVEPLVTQIVDVNYAKASSLLPLVQSLLSRDCAAGSAGSANAEGLSPLMGGGAGASRGSGPCQLRGAVTADTSTNKLLISEVPSRIPEIVARIRDLDVRTPQVAIKAKIIFVNRTGLEDIGISYDLGTGTRQFFNKLVQRIDPSTAKPMDTNGDGVPDAMGGGSPFGGDRVAVGGNALSALANADRALASSALNLIYSASIGRFQLTSFVNALQQSQLADVQSEPSIVTLNNRTAEIFVGQQIPIRVIDASAGGGGGGGGAAGGGQQNFPKATVRLEDAGIKLSVTPQVTNNRKIVLRVSAENSSAQVGSSDVGVIFNRQRAENQLLVGDGETAVIGGLTVTETSKNKSGIPFLVDLPLVGRLFGQVTKSETKRDLLILVTPHILDEGESAPVPEPRR